MCRSRKVQECHRLRHLAHLLHLRLLHAVIRSALLGLSSVLESAQAAGARKGCAHFFAASGLGVRPAPLEEIRVTPEGQIT